MQIKVLTAPVPGGSVLLFAAGRGSGSGGGGGGSGRAPETYRDHVRASIDLRREYETAPQVVPADFPVSGAARFEGFALFDIGASPSDQRTYAGDIRFTVDFDGPEDVRGSIDNVIARGFSGTHGETGYVGPVDGSLRIHSGSLERSQIDDRFDPDIRALVDGTLRSPEVTHVVDGRLSADFRGEGLAYMEGVFSPRDPEPFDPIMLGGFYVERQD